MRPARLIAPLTVAALGVAGLWYATDGLSALTTETARRAAAVRERPQVPASVLVSHEGTRLDIRDWVGSVVLVDFIYTRCNTLCRYNGTVFRQLQDTLAAPIAAGEVRMLSISFDPAHDTPARLAAYLDMFTEDKRSWRAAAPASRTDLSATLDGFGITVIDDGFGGYAHNAAVHIVAADGRLVRILDPYDVDAIRDTVQALL